MPRVAKSAPQPYSAEKLTVDVEQLVKEIASTPAAEPAPAPAPEKKVRRVVKKKEAAPAPAAEAPAPAAPAKRERHPNAKTFAKISDAVKTKLAGHAELKDKTYMRRLRTHLMLGKSYEEATKIANEKRAADAAKSA